MKNKNDTGGGKSLLQNGLPPLRYWWSHTSVLRSANCFPSCSCISLWLCSPV